MQTFFGEDDYQAYLSLVGQWCRREGVSVWAYCLMPNHVHLIVVPATEQGLARALGEAHRRYTRRVNSCLPPACRRGGAGRSGRAGAGISGRGGSRRW